MDLPDRRDLVPPPVVDGLSGEDLGLAAAQLVAAHSERPSASREHEQEPRRGGGGGGDSPEKQVSVLKAQADEVLASPVFSQFLETKVFRRGAGETSSCIKVQIVWRHATTEAIMHQRTWVCTRVMCYKTCQGTRECVERIPFY